MKNFRQNSLTLFLMLTSTLAVAQPTATSKELTTLDAVATMLGSASSFINNEPEAAINLFAHHQSMVAYANKELTQYANARTSRLLDRKKQLEQGLRHWNETLARYQEKMPTQIASELKRQRAAVERYKKSKRPRPSSFAYIPKTVWVTKEKLQVLTASGVDTKMLQEEQAKVEEMVMQLVKSIDATDLAKSTSTPRDAYRKNDRAAIEAFVTALWKKEHPNESIERFVMPKQSWSNTYGATISPQSKQIVPHEVDRITIYVAVKKSNEVLTLTPVRLARMNDKIHGKRLNMTAPHTMRRIPTCEFPFDVLARKIR